MNAHNEQQSLIAGLQDAATGNTTTVRMMALCAAAARVLGAQPAALDAQPSPVVKQNLTTQPAAAQEAAYQVRRGIGEPWKECDRAAFDVVTASRPADARKLYAAPVTAAQEAVATVESFTNGSYHRNYKLRWHKNVDAGTQLFAAPVTAAPADLIERCKEILAWQRTGVLPGDALRAYANARWPDEHDPLQIAEKETAREAFRILARAAAASTPAAPGIGLQAFRKVAMPLLCQMLCSHDAESVARKLHAALLDASPKGDAAEPLHAHYCNAQPSSAECICGLDSPKDGSEARDAVLAALVEAATAVERADADGELTDDLVDRLRAARDAAQTNSHGAGVPGG
ncbi:hypothetical protein MKP15_04140 [Stenotrophomonas sp. Y6]|uniref:hypothetical protein n=1 Tax=Stenotrophomonas sp. Y6 TaxID=2920383 RepID=UPI001F05F191|nr:hypothetical protein [Stenotrophomonas sp. Y6]MCH1907962.1 hypothetical protein [Stenotrophomonas sp. Y6]